MAYTPISPALTFHLVSAAGTNPSVVKNSPGTVNGWYIYNSNGSARKVTFHNIATIPSAGSGVVYSLVIPPLSAANVSLPDGITFTIGIGITTVTGISDSDASPVALNDLTINIFYK
jgi:hypothetical protein